MTNGQFYNMLEMVEKAGQAVKNSWSDKALAKNKLEILMVLIDQYKDILEEDGLEPKKRGRK